jgi:hypothetical protein
MRQIRNANERTAQVTIPNPWNCFWRMGAKFSPPAIRSGRLLDDARNGEICLMESHPTRQTWIEEEHKVRPTGLELCTASTKFRERYVD